MTAGEIGQMRLQRREFLSRLIGNSMLAIGGTLFGAAAAYEIYAHRAEASLADLKRGNYQIAGFPQPPAPMATILAAAAGSAKPNDSAIMEATVASTPPLGAEPAVFAAAAPAVQSPDVQPGMLPVRLNIPSIGLNGAKVVEVGTHTEKGVLVWETADHAVGHHIGTAVPGQPGNVVLSGHISSPIRGEGSIFRNLPGLSDKIGSRISVETADGSWFHYDIVGTDVVTPADTWVLGSSAAPVLTLLTCVPDGVYTHRFVALGKYAGKG